ncbi:hypothetical protein PIB30_005583 [Stylosanthes scabra]|uniref:Epidermal patterning factor-like protein n=1 Tax=Stylosanthes scabra TaxID=79078 RepID=A0ABU6R406_9FABA|nr:hypothetical protein [Stylosanthes scabra]
MKESISKRQKLCNLGEDLDIIITFIICDLDPRRRRRRMMKGRFLCFLLVLQSVSWVSVVAKKPFPAGYAMSHDPGRNESPSPKSSSPPYTTIESYKRKSERKMGVGYLLKAVSKIGSSPPSCEHKCYGCTPCEAIQVPSTGKRTHHLAIQYANYEPESWKCKCGPFFYSP